MLENHPLFLSVYICIAGVVVAAWEMVGVNIVVVVVVVVVVL
jgi:hypothetical protein